MRRFYLTELSSPIWECEGDEARHLIQVLRAKVGERFVAFDGHGHEASCEVIEVKKKIIRFKALTEVQEIDRRPLCHISVAVAFPKARARGILMEKLVELGVREVQPILCQRGVDAPDTERLKAQAITAMKQCGINHMPVIHPSLKLKDFCDNSNDSLVLLNQEGDIATPQLNPVTLLVGPEGGFSDEELALIKAQRWSLGNQILRCETACIAAVARLSAIAT